MHPLASAEEAEQLVTKADAVAILTDGALSLPVLASGLSASSPAQ